MHDLFLSYRRLDAERVAPLVAALNARGVTVWQDAHEIGDNASIQRAINDGLANARALLVWYSKDYNASRACQWELTTAYSAAQASGGDPRRRVLVVNPEASPGHIVLPELFDQLHLNAAVLSVDELAERIAARLAEQAAMLTGVGGAGRPGVLQVRGSGGMGKSLLAEEYALRFGAAYPGGVFWLRAYGYSDSDREIDPALREAQRDSQIRSIAVELGLNPHGLETPQVRGLLRRHFEGVGQPFLWIVDDLPPIKHTDELHPWLAPHEPLGRTLITTRARHINHIEKVELPQLDADEALRLLARATVLSAADEAAARAICEALGGHALAVDVTAPLAHDIGFAAVLDMLRQPDEDALEFAAELDELLPVDHQRSVAATFLASIQRLDEPGRDLLRLASVLASAPIPKQLQSGALGLVDQASDGAALKTAIRGRDQLIKSSLAENADEGAITVHTLVVRTIRFHDGRPERVAALRGAAVEVLLTKMPQVADIRTHEALKDWVAHARQVSMEAQDAQTAYLLGWVGQHDYQQGAYDQARNAFQRALDTRRRVLGEDHPHTLSSLSNLAAILQAQGDLVGARRYAEQVLGTMRRVLGERHPDTSGAAWNLFTMLVSMDEHEPAVQLLVNDLLWLLAEDPEQLGAAQRQIARMVRRAIGGGADLD